MEKDRFFQMRVDDAFLRMLDDWRRHQPDLPTRAGAVRRLVMRGVDADQTAPWTECAESLYLAIVGANKTGEASDALLEEANELFGRASGAVAQARGEPPGDPI